MEMDYLKKFVLHSRQRNQLYTIAIASGKGGVGKSSVAVNLSLALTLLKQKVILFDGDMGLGNVAYMLHLKGADATLEHVVAGTKSLEEVLIEGPRGLLVVPAGSGIEKLANLAREEIHALQKELQTIRQYGDFLIIDLSAGLSRTTIDFLSEASTIMVVTTPKGSAILDAYALLKVIAGRFPTSHVGIFVNQHTDTAEMLQVANRLKTTSEKFLGLDVKPLGGLKKDWRVEKAIDTQQPFVLQYPNALITKSMLALARLYIDRLLAAP